MTSNYKYKDKVVEVEPDKYIHIPFKIVHTNTEIENIIL